MRIFGLFLFVLLLPFFVATSVAAKAPVPPSLVPCKSEASCERSPEKWEAFVREFLNWYVARGEEINSHYRDDMPSQEWRKIFLGHQADTEKTLGSLLTPRFSKWRQRVNMNIPYTNRDFCPPDTDAILCAQDYDGETFKNASFSFSRAEKELVEIAVVQSPEYQFFVRLKVDNGAWRIDGSREEPLPYLYISTTSDSEQTLRQKMERFVRDFFRWRLENQDKIAKAVAAAPSKEEANLIKRNLLQRTENILRYAMTPSFFERQKLSDLGDPCSGYEALFSKAERLFCQPTLTLENIDNVKIQTLILMRPYGEVDLFFPPPYAIAIHLKLSDATFGDIWKIDGVNLVGPSE